MKELFPIASVKRDSPRLSWMKRHGVKVKNFPDVQAGDEDEFGNEIWPWTAFSKDAKDDEDFVGGATEDAALAKYAVAKGIRLWNEETTARKGNE